MQEIHFPIEIWFEIMNHQPMTYEVISRLSRWHYEGVADKLQYYKIASCKKVVEYDKKYYILPNGKHHGREVCYYASGKVRYECDYVDGKKHGKEIWYYKSGKIRWMNNYVDDKKHGKEVCYYASGKVLKECNYVDDNRHGKEICYYKSGEVEYEYNYVDDQRCV
ncbi:hypothetical protein D5b_00502 [Faustovirus]|nr:hypothetical protein D5b_00502 [Faustovirus]AMN84419.1 hypothetical protein D6_00006 [Faustovirus]AMP44440.1 hypothetical protein PRJ_Dakar_00490 [Faustovirus]